MNECIYEETYVCINNILMFIMYELLSVLMYAVRNCIINTKQTYFKEVVIHTLHTFKHTGKFKHKTYLYRCKIMYVCTSANN